jgi:hypothetical protein
MATRMKPASQCLVRGFRSCPPQPGGAEFFSGLLFPDAPFYRGVLGHRMHRYGHAVKGSYVEASGLRAPVASELTHPAGQRVRSLSGGRQGHALKVRSAFP